MSIAEMMAMFRQRSDAVRGLHALLDAAKAAQTANATEFGLALARLRETSQALLELCLERPVCGEKLLALWKRTHWALCTRETMLGQQLVWHVRLADPLSVDAVVPQHSVNCDSLASLRPFDSIHDAAIRAVGTLDEGRFLLVRVLAPAVGRVNGFSFLADDRRGNTFWVFSPALCVPHRDDGAHMDAFAPVGRIFALVTPALQMFLYTWEPQLACSYNRSRTIAIHDLSSELLRDTPWFEAPCATALEWKQRGNERFTARLFHAAVACYTHGIALESAIDLLANRAAANLKVGEWDAVVADCNVVLARDNAHRKCTMRRAAALSKLERHEEALNAWMRAVFLSVDSPPSDKNECTAGMSAALLARTQAEGQSGMVLLDPVNFSPLHSEQATFLHPMVQCAALGSRGMFARKAIPRDTRILIESPLAVGSNNPLLTDNLFLATCEDAHKRGKLATLCSLLHLPADDKDPIFTVARTCSFSIENEHRLFFRLSHFNHSCAPNCEFEPSPMVVKTTRAIRRGEELFISYTESDWTREERQKQLQLRMIDCKCARCTSPDDKVPNSTSTIQKPNDKKKK